MNVVACRVASAEEFDRVSRQLAQSYRAAYRGMMDEAYLTSLTEDHWVPILREGALRGDTCLVAEWGGAVIGTAVFGPKAPEQNRDCVMLYAIYLSPAHIGTGVGHLLYMEAERSMAGQGYKVCELEVLSANIRAIQFYQAHGFEKTASFTVSENGMDLRCDQMHKRLYLTREI